MVFKHKRIVRAHIKIRTNQTPAREVDHEKDVLSVLKDLVGILAGSGVLFLALFWINGRAYVGGYFGALNIPAGYISFSTWEYAEISWRLVALYSSFLALFFSFGLGLFNIVISFLRSQLLKIREKMSLPFFDTIGYESDSAVLKIANGIAILAATVLAVVFMVTMVMSLIYQYGKETGRKYLFESASLVEAVSAVPLDLGNPEIITYDHNTWLYKYSQLRLLTYAGDKYYFYIDGELENCLPTKVHIVEDSQILELNILPPKPIVSSCIDNPQNADELGIPTPTSTP